MAGPTPPADDRAVLVRVAVPSDGPDGALTVELLAAALFDLGATGIEETTADDGRAVLVAGFANRPAATAAIAGLERTRAADPDRPPIVIEVPDDTWFDGWRAYARAQRAGRHVVVHPPWVPLEVDPPVGPDDLVLTIDPGRSFGSGAHPTTRLVLGELERLVRPGSRVLDLGCGSGVLAVAAARLGAVDVLAVDIDPAALVATEENARRNGVAFPVVADLPAAPPGGVRFDVAAANIGANTLVGLAPLLAPQATTLVLSGFFRTRSDEVAAAYAAEAFTVTGATTDDDGWAVLVMQRRPVGPGDHVSGRSL